MQIVFWSAKNVGTDILCHFLSCTFLKSMKLSFIILNIPTFREIIALDYPIPFLSIPRGDSQSMTAALGKTQALLVTK